MEIKDLFIITLLAAIAIELALIFLQLPRERADLQAWLDRRLEAIAGRLLAAQGGPGPAPMGHRVDPLYRPIASPFAAAKPITVPAASPMAASVPPAREPHHTDLMGTQATKVSPRDLPKLMADEDETVILHKVNMPCGPRRKG